MSKFTDFYNAWWYLQEHAYFINYELLAQANIRDSSFNQGLDISVQKVNPLTKTIDGDESKNTETSIWLEAGPYELVEDFPGGTPFYCSAHDIALDCGGATFEEAIIALANLVEKQYPIKKWGKIDG